MAVRTGFDIPISTQAGTGIAEGSGSSVWQPGPIRLEQGAIAAAVAMVAPQGASASVLLSGAGGPGEPAQLTVETAPDHSILVRHVVAGEEHVFSTPAAVYAEGDLLKVGYSWDASGKGGALIVRNVSTDATHTVAIDAALTIDLVTGGDDDWRFGPDGAEAADPAPVTAFAVKATAMGPAQMLDGLVEGTAGDDLIDIGYLGDPEGDRIDAGDAILPGSTWNDDYVIAGDGNDTVDAGRGDDTVLGGAGDDFVRGRAGDDYIDGGDGNDTLDGGGADDTLIGGRGMDHLAGDSGADLLDGGDDDDFLFGGTDDDTLIGGAGSDTQLGGDDRDTFTGTTAGDSIDGGEGGIDFDTLDLRDWGKSATNIIYDPNNPENGIVEFLDPQGNIVGTLTFENIENIVPCFTPGTAIATPRGERAVEELAEGDRVVTRDNGIQEIRWIGQRTLDYGQLGNAHHLKPILVTKGCLGQGLPERDMLVSPNHRFLVANERTMLYFEEHEVLVAAKHLIDNRTIRPVNSLGITYVHFMCDRHEVVLANGCWTESFQPGDYSLNGLGNAQRNEIYEIFPELAEARGRKAYVAARRTLKRHEAALLRQ